MRLRLAGSVLDGISFLEINKDLSAREEQLRQHIRNICEKQIRPIAAKLWHSSTFEKRFIQACRDMGPAGLQIKGFGEPYPAFPLAGV